MIRFDNIAPIPADNPKAAVLVQIFEQDCFRHSPSWASFSSPTDQPVMITAPCGRCGKLFTYRKTQGGNPCLYCKGCLKHPNKRPVEKSEVT